MRELGAIDAEGRITERGRRLRELPLPPRIARMVVEAASAGEARLGADIAALLTERGLGGNDPDLDPPARRIAPRSLPPRGRREGDGATMGRDCGEWHAERILPGDERLSPGVLLALAYPDRIAKSRGAGGSFLLANGRGANVDPASSLSREPFLAVGEIAGTAAQGRILLGSAADAR